MYGEINDSKELIKRRMVKHAMNYYDIKSGDEQDLDPIVQLILEALSAELYNLGNDIVDTQVRVLEKIANLLAPDFLTCPNPAHAILHAIPLERTDILNDKTDFFRQIRISSKNDDVLDTSINAYFTPVDNIKIFDAQIAFSVTSSKLFGYENALNRQLLPTPKKGQIAEANTIWLGLRVNNEIEDINNLSFCFDWKTYEPQLAYRINSYYR